MGNRVMKNDKNLQRTAEYDSNSNINADHQSPAPRVPTDTNFSKSSIAVEDATAVTTDSPTISTTEYESASANDNDITSLNRLSSCTDISFDIPFDTKTLDLVEEVQGTMETTNQVSAACIGSLVFSQEEDEFHSLTDEPVHADDEKLFEVEANSIVHHQLQTVEDMKNSCFTKPTLDESKEAISNALCDVLNKVSIVLESCHRGPEELRLVDLCSLSLAEMLNLRALFPAVFAFSIRNVVLSHNGFVYQLEEEEVNEFLADRFSYLAALKEVVFELANYSNELSYLTRVNEEQMTTFSRPILRPVERTPKCGQVAVVKPYREDPRKDRLSEPTANYASQFETEDIMNCGENVSEAGPTTAANIDHLNNIPLLNDSRDLDFISKVGGTGLVAENLRKQSLYVKFDPLVASEVNNSSLNGDTTLTNDVCTLSLNDTVLDTNSGQVSDEGHNFSAEVTDSNEPVGKLISVTPNKSPRKPTPKSSPRFPESDPDDLNELKSLLLKQMKREEAFKEEIESVRREHEQTLQKLLNVEKRESQLRNALEAAQENEKKLKNELKERIKSKQQLSMVMEEYEKTISQMVTRRDEEKREFEASVRKIETERDSAIQHLNNLENAFNDVHQKYERGKLVNEALKKNEDTLKKSLCEFEVTVKTVENKYELLKSHATSQLEKANQELELITQTYEKEQAKLKAMLRKSEIQINSLQNALDQKAKENQELTAVCDELIVKLSTHSNA